VRTPAPSSFTAATKVAAGGKKVKPLDADGRKTLDALVASLKQYYKA
jgi:hypothetical protein